MSDPGPAPAIQISVDSSIRARALALLFLAGGTIGAISMLLPHSAEANEPALWSNVAVAYLAGVALVAIGPRLPGWAFHVSLALGSLLVMRAVLAAGDANSFYSIWFVWVGL